MSNNRKVYLGWAHAIKDSDQNFGDELSPFIVKAITGRDIQYIPVVHDRFHLLKLIMKRLVTLRFLEFYAFSKVFCGKRYVLALGSILQFYRMNGAVVWGSGLISQDSHTGKHKILAVRGPYTREILIKKGYNDVPEVYGDPALLLKQIYNPKISKKHRIGIIPHIVQYNKFLEDFAIEQDNSLIDFRTGNVTRVIDQILSCDYILSSSLHGLIVAHTYGIPAIWVEFGGSPLMGDNVKFRDYFASLRIKEYQPFTLSPDISLNENLNRILPELSNLQPTSNMIDKCVKGLLANSPF